MAGSGGWLQTRQPGWQELEATSRRARSRTGGPAVADSACESRRCRGCKWRMTLRHPNMYMFNACSNLYLLLFSPWLNFASQPLGVDPAGLESNSPKGNLVGPICFFSKQSPFFDAVTFNKRYGVITSGVNPCAPEPYRTLAEDAECRRWRGDRPG